MAAASPEEVTELLNAWSEGDEEAFARLVPLVKSELNRLARAHLRKESPHHSFETADLVNAAYVRLIKWKDIPWKNRAHFIGTTSRLMRNILIDHSRKKQHQRELRQVSLTAAAREPQALDADVLAVHDALSSLASVDQRQADIVEWKMFGGYTLKEIAHSLGLSVKTIERDYEEARLWLFRYLNNQNSDESSGQNSVKSLH